MVYVCQVVTNTTRPTPPAPTVTGSNRGRRAGLTRTRVIETAVQILDRDGLEAFSLRRLATELGVETMSLYNHVANRDDLLDGVVEHVYAELIAPRGTRKAATWQNQIRKGATRFRQVMLAHPHASIVVLTRRVLTDTPLAAMRGGLKPLLDAGLSNDQAIQALRSLTAYLTGTILREIGAGETYAINDPDRTAQRVQELAATDDPLLADMADRVAAIDHAAQFDFGVELFIAGIQAATARR